MYTYIYSYIRGEKVVNKYEKAIFAGGCFWCMVKPFDQQPGIIKVTSGYTGGTVENPTYQQVCSGSTGHYEAVEITYEPAIFPYEKLLSLFWQQIDPTDAGGQFYDRGKSYQSAIFYHNEKQKKLAEESKEQLAESGRFSKPIVTPIVPAMKFYPAEGYHQDYYKKNSKHYESYHVGSGRAGFIHSHWGISLGNKDLSQLKKELTPIQFEVTQNSATEPPFRNEFWNEKQAGSLCGCCFRQTIIYFFR